MIRLIGNFILSMILLYSSGYLTVEVLKRLEKAGKIRIAKGLSPMREFNRKLFVK